MYVGVAEEIYFICYTAAGSIRGSLCVLPGAMEVEILLGPALGDRKLLSGFETMVFTGVTPLGPRWKGEGP